MAKSEFHPTALKWAKDFLRYVKAPVTAANIRNLISWSAKENTQARFNPLGTVDKLPGSSDLYPGQNNGTPVQNYRSYRDGIKANALHITKYTPEILKALRRGNLTVSSFANVVAASGWGSGTFATAAPDYVSPSLGNGSTNTLAVNKQSSYVFPLPAGSYQTGGGPHQGTHNQSDWQSGNAQDYLAPGGTPVSSPVAGTVIKVSGHDPSQGVIKSGSKIIFGQSVTIKAANGQEWFLTHLGGVSVKAGQTITAGQLLGAVGDIKGGTPHLHIAVNSGDPASILAGGSAPSGAVPTGAPPTPASYGIAPYDPSQSAPPQIPTETGIAPPGSQPIGAPEGRSPQETWQLISQQQFVSPDTQSLLQGA